MTMTYHTYRTRFKCLFAETAWRLNIRSRFLVYICIIAVSLTACDPISLPYDAVERVVVLENTAYLFVVERDSTGLGMGSDEIPYYFIRQDSGEWQEIISPPEGILQAISQVSGFPRIVCLHDTPNTCYRITGLDQVEFTDNGGDQWQVVWKMPLGRQGYMQGDIERRFHLNGVIPDTCPYDLGIVEKDDGYEVMVAFGNQGILVRTPGGSWERQAVALARPVPYQAQNLSDVTSSLGLETFCAISVAVLFLLCLLMARLIYPRIRFPLYFPMLLFAAIWFPFALWSMGLVPIYSYAIALAVLLCLVLFLILIRLRKKVAPKAR